MFTKSSLLVGALITLMGFGYLRNWLKDTNYDISTKVTSLKGKKYRDLEDYDERRFPNQYFGWMSAIVVETWTVGFWVLIIVGFIYSIITKGVDWDTW